MRNRAEGRKPKYISGDEFWNKFEEAVMCPKFQLQEEREWTTAEEREAFLCTSRMNMARWMAENNI